MASLLHHRLANWLTTLLAAFWPVAAASACCCAARAASDGDECPPGCCAAAVDARGCCTGGADDRGICCATSAEREACGCLQQCGQSEPERKAAGTIESGSAPSAALASGLIAAWPAVSDVTADWNADEIPRRPKRILYGVWRN